MPQLVAVMRMSVQLPLQHSLPVPAQASLPAAAAVVPPHVHRPPAHISEGPHTWPQPPQFDVLVAIVTHAPEQHSLPAAGHASPAPTELDTVPQTHRPPEQVSLGPQ